MKSIFDVFYESIKITTIGMKFGKSVFVYFHAAIVTDTTILSVLSNLEGLSKGIPITLKLQYSNRRLKN